MRRPSFEFLPNHSTELPGLGRRQIALLGLRVDVHHVERLVAGGPVVDDPQPAALAPAGGCPPDFAQAVGPLDDGPLFRPQHERDLQLAIPSVVEMRSDRGREHVRLDEPQGSLVYAIGAS